MKSKFTKTLALGICFTALSANIALANGRGIDPASLPGQEPINMIKVDSRQQVDIIKAPTDAPDAAVSYLVDEPRMISEELLRKQSEIDQYLFEDHIEEITKKGFNVTHTGPFDAYVEIGITPYNEENANYLYSIFGEDEIKVVEGLEAELYTTMVATDAVDDAVVAVTSANEDEQEPKPLTAYAIGGALLIGGSLMTKRKFKLIK